MWFVILEIVIHFVLVIFCTLIAFLSPACFVGMGWLFFLEFYEVYGCTKIGFNSNDSNNAFRQSSVFIAFEIVIEELNL